MIEKNSASFVFHHYTFWWNPRILKKSHVAPGERVKLMEVKHKDAFEVLSKDGKISETAVVEALLHGHEKMLCVEMLA